MLGNFRELQAESSAVLFEGDAEKGLTWHAQWVSGQLNGDVRYFCRRREDTAET